MIRPPEESDLDSLARLRAACELHDLGPDVADGEESIRADLVADWNRDGFDPITDARVAVEGGDPVGYADVHMRSNGEAFINGCVSPNYRGRGIGTGLVNVLEERAAAAEKLRTVVTGANPTAHAFFVGRSYEACARSWRMEIQLDEPPAAPAWPAGVRVRTVVEGQDEHAVHELIEAAFSDQRPDRVPVPYEEWAGYMFRPDTDLSLYFVAERNGELVGAVLCPWYPDTGWIRQVAVRADQRGQGLGLALLHHAFGALYARGHRRVGLGVDELNETGAKRLYERAGMRAVIEHRWYERAQARPTASS